MKTSTLLPTLTTILGVDTDVCKNLHCKFAILHINRTYNFRKFYLLEERQLTLLGKRHWREGWKKASKMTWGWKERLEEWETINWWWLWLINKFLMKNMLLRMTLHKKIMKKILKSQEAGNLNKNKKVL